MALTPTFAPSDQDRVAAGKMRSRLVSNGARGGDLQITVGGEALTLSGPVAAAILRVLEEMEKGNALAVLPAESELGTQDAADLLNVSRQYVVGLLDKGELPYRMVGGHHRIPVNALLAYKEQAYANSSRLLDVLTQEAQDLGLGYPGQKDD